MKAHWLSFLFRGLRIGRGAERRDGAGPMADPEFLKQMVRGIVTTCSDELGCDECFERVDRFAEMVLDGKRAADAMPLVQDHLNRCGDCHEEFEALLTVLRAMA